MPGPTLQNVENRLAIQSRIANAKETVNQVWTQGLGPGFRGWLDRAGANNRKLAPNVFAKRPLQ